MKPDELNDLFEKYCTNQLNAFLFWLFTVGEALLWIVVAILGTDKSGTNAHEVKPPVGAGYFVTILLTAVCVGGIVLNSAVLMYRTREPTLDRESRKTLKKEQQRLLLDAKMKELERDVM